MTAEEGGKGTLGKNLMQTNAIGTVNGYQIHCIGKQKAHRVFTFKMYLRNVESVNVSPTKTVSYHILLRTLPTDLSCMSDCELPGADYNNYK